MPEGTPGMTGAKTGKFTIYAVNKGANAPFVYATE